jgi:hypothetical protein
MCWRLAAVPATLVFYETGPRLVASLEAMAQHLPGRELAVARELTKLHEECRRAGGELIAHYTAHPPKGEIVLLAGPRPRQPRRKPMTSTRCCAPRWPRPRPRRRRGMVAKAHGLDRKALYARAMELESKDDQPRARAEARGAGGGLGRALLPADRLARSGAAGEIGVGEVDLVVRRGGRWPLSR